MKSNSIGGMILIGISILGFIMMFSSFSSACSEVKKEDHYRDNLESGYEKYQKGENMTREEYNAVKNFNEWKDKQGEKTYSDWNN